MDQETLTGLRKALKGKRARFCEEYIIDGNGTDAVIRAGITENRASASVIASRYLLEPAVRAYIDALTEAAAEAAGVSLNKLIVHTEEIRRRCMQHKPVMEFNPETKAWEPTGEYVFNTSGALRAVEDLAKMTGNWQEKRIIEADNEFEVIFTRKGERDETSS